MTDKFITEYAQDTSPGSTDAILIDQGAGAYKYATVANILNSSQNASFGTLETTGNATFGGDVAIPNGDLYTVARSSFTTNEVGGGTMTYTSTTVNWARRKKVGDTEYIGVSITGTTGGTASTYITIDLPSTPENNNDSLHVGYNDNGVVGVGQCKLQKGTTKAIIIKNDETNWSLGTVSFTVNGAYEID